MSEVPEAQPNIQIQLPEKLIGGVWANYAQVSHSPYEFTIDFARLDLSQASEGNIPGRVVARVNVSPLLVSQFIDALNENWQKYVQKAMPKEVGGDGHNDDDQD